MTPYPRLKKKERLKLLKLWDTFSKPYEKMGYKPTGATDRQLDLINYLANLLDRRDASTLIDLLDELIKRDNGKKNGANETEEHVCSECGQEIIRPGKCMRCYTEAQK